MLNVIGLNFPDPVALIHFVAGDSTIIRFIPADGIKEEFAISRAAIINGWLAEPELCEGWPPMMSCGNFSMNCGTSASSVGG